MNPIIVAVSGILAVFLTAMASFMLMPIEDNFYKTNQNNATTQVWKDTSQSQHSIFVMAPPLFVGALFMSAFLRSVRKTSEEDWDA